MKKDRILECLALADDYLEDAYNYISDNVDVTLTETARRELSSIFIDVGRYIEDATMIEQERNKNE